MTRRRYELMDHEWSIISPLLPNKPSGVPRVDDRRVLNGILWRFRTGSPWAEVPERYGPPPPAITASCVGGRPVSGIVFLKPFQRLMTATSS